MELFDKRFMYLEWDDKLKGKEVFLGDTLPQLRVSVNGNCNSIQEVSNNVDDDSFYPFISPCGTRYAMAYYDPNYSCKVAYAQGKTIQYRTKDSSDAWKDCEGSPFWGEVCEYREKPEPEEQKTLEQHKLRVYKCSDDTLHISPYCIMTDFLFEGTADECKQYIKEHYCNRCVHQSCDMVVSTQFCKGFKEPKIVHHMTNRELAKWVWQGNGQVKNRDGYFTLIASTAYDVRDDDKPCPDCLVIRGWDETEWHEPEAEE